ncbi:MAG TPA: hypothetical protein VH598_16345 [Verrucomicrobiae bacterium]|jgi:hypothetical protein|nr:hypothetical protein [Verrucomicrobiae bacterium]
MIRPQQRFKESPHAKTWLDRVDSGQFQDAASAALLQMAQINANAPDMATAASYQWRMAGALQFLSLLMNLTEPVPERKAPVGQNLDHRA